MKKSVTFVVSREERTNGFYYSIICREIPHLRADNIFQTHFFDVMEQISLDCSVNLNVNAFFQID